MDVEENLHKCNQSRSSHMEIPFQKSFSVRQVVRVEDHQLGEEVGSSPCHFGPNHPTPVVTDQHNLSGNVCDLSVSRSTSLSLGR